MSDDEDGSDDEEVDMLLADFAKDAEKFSRWCKDVKGDEGKDEPPAQACHMPAYSDMAEYSSSTSSTVTSVLKTLTGSSSLPGGAHPPIEKKNRMTMSELLDSMRTEDGRTEAPLRSVNDFHAPQAKIADRFDQSFTVLSSGNPHGCDTRNAAKAAIVDTLEVLSSGMNPFRLLAYGASFVVLITLLAICSTEWRLRSQAIQTSPPVREAPQGLPPNGEVQASDLELKGPVADVAAARLGITTPDELADLAEDEEVLNATLTLPPLLAEAERAGKDVDASAGLRGDVEERRRKKHRSPS